MKKLLTLAVLAVAGWAAYAVFWPSSLEPQAQPAAAGRRRAASPTAVICPARPAWHTAWPKARRTRATPRAPVRRLRRRHHPPLRLDGGDSEVFATTNGRPLGLAFAEGPVPRSEEADSGDGENSEDGGDRADQTLIVADADKGLLAIDAEGDITVLASGADGTPFAFTNDVDVADNGQIYFSDASSRYGQTDYRTDLLEHGGHGRLLKYDPATGRTTVLLGGLQFANGVAVGPDDAYVLVVETGSYRICRYWLTGDRAGQSDIFIDNLPGFPDGLSFDGEGTFWLALFAPRDPLLDFAADKPWLRAIVHDLPRELQPQPAHVGHVIGLNTDARVIANLRDAGDRAFAPITSVERVGDSLYLGSLTAPAFARIRVPDAGR